MVLLRPVHVCVTRSYVHMSLAEQSANLALLSLMFWCSPKMKLSQELEPYGTAHFFVFVFLFFVLLLSVAFC
jgi:hypothetical protein